jgi:hypothetical protein
MSDDDVGNSSANPCSLLDAAAAFLFGDEMQAEIDEFVRAHAPSFADASADGEQRLEWQHVFEEYAQLYEARSVGRLDCDSGPCRRPRC